jgi:tRNA A37 threonylcarbamoyladenosine dehydratase
MDTSLNFLAQKTQQHKNIYLPSFFRIKNPEEKIALNNLLLEDASIKVYDEILGQVEELVKCRYPKKVFKKDELTEAAKEFLGATDWNEYGVWVYYPWASRIVHILDEIEFIDVRTNRNQYKITLEERNKLANQKIGVVGLSVGQSVAMTMAMERCFGEIRLADFDLLELSNLNRIRTGVHNLGISKVISVAREIMELDPYVNVKCYLEGITEENIEQFLLDGGKLDLLIDECDGLDMKLLCRQRAKLHKIPLVMEASDRGSIDVERFDLDPDRSIFHGLLEHLDTSKMKNLTNEEKVPYLLSIHPPETLSKRMKASMLEVKETITTWPQLGSGVVLGGALVTDVSRRILLDQFHDSGRYFVDIEEIIKDKEKLTKYNCSTPNLSPLKEEEMKSILSSLPKGKTTNVIVLDKETIEEIVQAAIAAPTGGNSQPWKWLYSNGILALYLDKIRSTSFLDYKNNVSYIGFGAALENLVLKARSLQYDAQINLFPLGEDEKLIATIGFLKKDLMPERSDDLVSFITTRCTNRIIKERQPIEQSILNELKKVITSETGAELRFIDTPNDLEGIADIVGRAERIRLLNPRSHHDFFEYELRWNQEHSKKTNDGVDLMTMNLSLSDTMGLQVVRDSEVMSLLKQWNLGGALQKIRKKTVQAASVVGLISMPLNNKADYIKGGRLLERVWLTSQKHNIAFQPLYVPITLFDRLEDKDTELPTDLMSEVQKMRDAFLTYFPWKQNAKEVTLFRLCLAENPSVKSLRRPLEEVLYFE